MTTAAEIRQELVLRAPRATVWNALSTPEGWTGWFSDGVEGTFEVGHDLMLDFEGHGTVLARVVECDAMNSFAYRWHPGGEVGDFPEEEMTLVRFTLEDHPEGTRLLLVESGFDRLPDTRRVSAFDDNTGGWRYELAELQTFVESGTRQNPEGTKIIRERSYSVSRARLWELVATPEGLNSWWTERVEGDFEVGSIATFHFTPKVSGPIKVVEREEPSVFAYRWHPGQSEGCTWDQFPESETTLVRFVLTEMEGGSHLSMTESGFENVPESRRSAALEGNRGGWNQVMKMIGDAAGGGS